MNTEFLGPAEGIMVINSFLTSHQCKDLIDFCEGRKWHQAATVGPDGKPTYSDYRNNDQTAVPMNSELDKFLHRKYNQAINEYITKHNVGGDLVDEAYRVLKYEPGQKYGIHMDCSDKNPRVLSSLIYLNDTEQGGEIEFGDGSSICPSTGTLVMFPSNFLFWHESKPVIKGVKYAVVTFFNYKKRVK